MRSPGSVLIVVLGLLAILAVVGITFVTMSNIDRRTAANFALQSQFMLAGDAAVDYVCHHLIQDLWYYDLGRQEYQYQQGSGGTGRAALLLTDQNTENGAELARNEPFDYPSALYDPWLSSPPAYTAGQGLSIPANGHFSYGEKGGTYYGLTSWGFPGTTPEERPNNLGWPHTDRQVRPYTQGNGHGVWNPDLAFPFDVGLIRVSVTVLDHAGMLNLNAHGRSDQSVNNAQDGCPRYGYFTSDIDPTYFGFRSNLLFGGAASVPGLWSQQIKPYNDLLYEAVIENPGRYGDHPFTLDEEFELRRLTGTRFRSRLEQFASTELDCAPDTVNPPKHARNRASLTTVSWTSEVRPDWESPTGAILEAFTYLPDRTRGRTDWSPRKLDLNLDAIDDLKRAMTTGYVFDEGDEDARQIRNQLLANIAAFRDGSDFTADPIRTWPEAADYVGAAPQPLLSKIKVTWDSEEKDGEEVIHTTWAVEVQVISPWRGNVYGDTEGLSVGNVTLTAVVATAGGTAAPFEPAFPKDARMPANPVAGVQWTHTAKVETEGTEPIGTKLTSIELRAAGPCIDRIGTEVLSDTELNNGGSMHRQIYRELETRRPGDTEAIDVVYIGNWVNGDGGGMTSFAFADSPPNGIPIRFPRSVKVSTEADADTTYPVKGMPPYPGANVPESSFRAFARLADLNQVLCPSAADLLNLEEGEHFFWPWVTRVAKKAGMAGQALLTEEEKLKFNWNDSEPTPGTPSRMNAANVFCVGGPWLDRLDNDGDGYTDEDGYAGETADEGKGPDSSGAPGVSRDGKGRFGGPELRVAGKINLNTATDDTLRAMAETFDLQDDLLLNYVRLFRNQNRPIVTPAQIIAKVNFTDVPAGREEAKGAVERRDLPYTLISNVASTRGDTFSIYGTIEYGLLQGAPPNTEFQVMRRRRFWALVDRSPCLAYPPAQYGGADEDFIRPRILNFQWLD